jgi:hypothetical protein
MPPAFREVWTVARGPEQPGPELVLLAPPTQTNASVFAHCRPLVGRGRPVRLVGEGVTIERYWPEWVANPPGGLRLTELDAYLPDEKGPPLADVTGQIEGWLDRIFDGVVPGARPSKIFWTSALDRHLDRTCQAWLLAAGLDAAHPHDEIVCTDPSWDCFRFVQARRGVDGRAGRWRLRLAATALAVEAASVGKRLYEFARERRVRRALAERRAQLASEPEPRIWIAVLGHWPRASRPVVEKIAPLVRGAGERLGVLLQGGLAPGLRVSNNLPVQADAILPTLDAPELDGVVAALDQAVSAESLPSLLGVVGESAALSARALVRFLREPLTLRLGGRAVQPLLAPLPLAKLLTLDVLRARESFRAARALARRRSLAGATVVWPHAGAIVDTPLIQALAPHATTVELVHGVTELGYQIGSGRSYTAVKALWSLPEARALERFSPGQRCLGGYYPRPSPPPVRRAPFAPGAPIPVLVASNYLVNAWGFDPRMFEHYQEPLLHAAVEAQRALPWPIELRWRPHPDDDPERVERLRQAWPQFLPSVGSLDEDFRWARVLVTSMSSITIEALAYRLPVFVHEIPWWNQSLLAAFDPARRFGGARPLAELLGPCLEALVRGDAAALAPEAAFERALFGSGGQPASPASLIGLDAAPLRAGSVR